MPTAQPVRFDKYILLDRIAMGGMAEVFRAKLIGEKGFEKPVVLKKMLPHLTDEEEMVRHFIDEARLAAQLKHENIIHIYDFGMSANTFFIAMEYLFGKDLSMVLKRSAETGESMPLETCLFIVSRICEGLAYAHNLTDLNGNPLDIVHRDISPHNIFITYEGNIKIIDFGIAKAASRSTKTQTGIIKGKAAYMSPEQAAGNPIDRRSDLYAVGILLYELSTGRKMFEGDTFQVLSRVINGEYEPPETLKPDLPEPVVRILHKSLRINPDERYASCEEMQADIEDCIYKLGYRPGSRKLSSFMQSLFEGHYDLEKRKLSQTMTASRASLSSADHRPENGGGYAATAAGETQPPKPMEPTSTAMTYGATPEVSPDQAGIRRRKRRLIAVALVLVSLICVGIPVGYLVHDHYQKTEKIDKLLETAEACMADGRITSPQDNCGYHYYQEVLTIDPGNRPAREGLAKVVSKCISLAQKEIDKFNLPYARHYIAFGLRIDPENKTLLAMKRKTANGADFYFDGIKSFFK